MNKIVLRQLDLFFEVDPNNLETFEEWVEYLESILNNPRCTVTEIDGKLELLEIKALVATIRGMKIEVFSKEHAPPHFHVKSANIDASFTIQDCKLLNGKINNSEYQKILFWFNNGAKQMVIDSWNSSRPSNCSVGPYKE